MSIRANLTVDNSLGELAFRASTPDVDGDIFLELCENAGYVSSKTAREIARAISIAVEWKEEWEDEL